MILLGRALVRLFGFLLLVVCAIAGIVLAAFCIGTGTTGPSPGGLANLLGLAAVRDEVGLWLERMEAPGPVAMVAAVSGLGAMLLGILLLLGLLVPRKERLVTLASSEAGEIGARRRPLGQAATALVEQVRGVTEARVRVRPIDAKQVEGAVTEQLDGLAGPFGLKTRIDVPRRGARVE